MTSLRQNRLISSLALFAGTAIWFAGSSYCAEFTLPHMVGAHSPTASDGVVILSQTNTAPPESPPQDDSDSHNCREVHSISPTEFRLLTVDTTFPPGMAGSPPASWLLNEPLSPHQDRLHVGISRSPPFPGWFTGIYLRRSLASRAPPRVG